MTRARSVAAIAALVLIVAACSQDATTPTPSIAPSPAGSGTASTCPTAPDPTDLPESWTPTTGATSVIPFVVTNRVVCGQSRILFLFLDDAEQVVSAPDRTATVAFYNLARNADVPVTIAEGEFTWAIPDARGMYIVDVELPEAGIWGAEFTTEAPGAPTETIRMQLQVADSSPTIQVGQEAPASDTPTLDDVGGDLAKLSTDDEPVEAFYETSVADALADGQPFLLAFATPKFCASAQCGPTLDRLKPVAAEHPGVTFINVEPYHLEVVDGQLQPVLDANRQLTAAPAVTEWGLLSEPWVFVVDGDGIVRGSFEGVVGEGELERALAEVDPRP
jgi:hypothetical protein